MNIFTEAPWFVASTGNILDKNGCRIAKVDEMPGSDFARLANANLISISPDMWDMLERLRNHIDLTHPEGYEIYQKIYDLKMRLIKSGAILDRKFT